MNGALAIPLLTSAQIAILQWIADGKRSDDIALLMGLGSAKTVDAYLVRICDKTGAASRAAAVAWALRRGIIK